MKNYIKPTIEEEIILLEDVIADSGDPTQDVVTQSLGLGDTEITDFWNN